MWRGGAGGPSSSSKEGLCWPTYTVTFEPSCDQGQSLMTCLLGLCVQPVCMELSSLILSTRSSSELHYMVLVSWSDVLNLPLQTSSFKCLVPLAPGAHTSFLPGSCWLDVSHSAGLSVYVSWQPEAGECRREVCGSGDTRSRSESATRIRSQMASNRCTCLFIHSITIEAGSSTVL